VVRQKQKPARVGRGKAALLSQTGTGRQEVSEDKSKHLFLKLGVGIVVVFGLVLAGYYVYGPLEFAYYKSQLQSDDPATVQSAVAAVAAKGKPAIPVVREWLRSPSDKVVIGACKILENMSGDFWQDALPELEAELSGPINVHSDAAAAIVVKKEYACSLNMLYDKSQWNHYQNAPYIRRNICFYVLDKTDVLNWRCDAIWALQEFRDVQIARRLITALETDPDGDIRWRAAYVLGEIGDVRAVEPLLTALAKDSDDDVRKQAAKALGKIGDDRAFEPLLKALGDVSNPGVQSFAAGALGIMGNNLAVEPLIRTLVDISDPDIRSSAADALGEIGDNRAIEPLIRLLENDSNAEVRRCAAYALDKIGDIRAVEPLIKAIENDSDEKVRWYSALALGVIGNNRAVEPLINILENDDDYDLHWIAANALGDIGDNQAVDPLIKALNESDWDGDLARCAAYALGKIGDERATLPLIKAIRADAEPDLRNDEAALQLSTFSGDEVEKALEAAKKMQGAALALAWRRGGKYLDKAGKLDLDIDLDVFLSCALLHWGNSSGLEKVVGEMHLSWTHGMGRFHAYVFALMPDGFPEYDFKANYATRKKQVEEIKKWYKENKSRIAWDAEKRRYYLKPEK
jgi:HEAT repeat protein